MADYDNLYPNGAFQISQDQELKNEEATEAAKVFNALPLVEEIIQRFKDRIEFYNSIDSIPEGLHTVPDMFMHAFVANKLARDNLQAETDYLEDLLESYAKK